MTDITDFGFMEIVSESNKDTVSFRHGSGKMTFVLIYSKNDILVQKAYWMHLGYGGPIDGDQERLWRIFNQKIKSKLH